MSANSKIEWLTGADGSKGSTWNPIRARLREPIEVARPDGTLRVIQPWGYHCEHISPGCLNCYAETMNRRMLPAWGTGLKYNVPNREKVEIFLDEAELMKPLRWKKPRSIFPCSMTDWCADFVTDEMRDRMLAVAALCPQHRFLFLTKRADRCAEYFMYPYRTERILQALFKTVAPWADNYAIGPNLWLGFSAENQLFFDIRWSHMRKLSAAGWNVWCSAEPLLSGINMEAALKEGLRWCVVGGESGPGARPFNIQWARDIIRQCRDAGVACFVKQLGARPEVEVIVQSDGHGWMRRVVLKDRKGGDMSEWPEDLRVREVPR